MAAEDGEETLELETSLSGFVMEGVRLTELIGSGSYAKVYRGAWKGTKVAVKQLHEVFSHVELGVRQSRALRETFYKELRMNMRLRHPNIIQFLGVVLPPRGRPEVESAGVASKENDYPMMVMELMYCTLEKRLHEFRERNARLPLCKAVDIAEDVAAALVYLHGLQPQPIAHRDLAPKNILLSPSDAAKLCDLGVAKCVRGSANNTRGPGTLPYMPPEVLIGTNYTPTAVDVYSFGVTLLEICSGKEPQPKEFIQMSEGLVCEVVPEKKRRSASFSALPPTHPLEPIITKCLELKADKRPTAIDLITTLQALKKKEEYLKSKESNSQSHEKCANCRSAKEEGERLRHKLREKDDEVNRLQDEVRVLKNFREERLRLLSSELKATAEEGRRYQLRLEEMQKALLRQEKTNHELEATNDRTMYLNQLLKDKVEMDSDPSRFSNPPPKPSEWNTQSGSVKYSGEKRPRPSHVQFKFGAAVTNGLDSPGERGGRDRESSDHSTATSICGSPMSRVLSEPELVARHQNTYLEVIGREAAEAAPDISKTRSHVVGNHSNGIHERFEAVAGVKAVPTNRGGGGERRGGAHIGHRQPIHSKSSPFLRTTHTLHNERQQKIEDEKKEEEEDPNGHIYVTIPGDGPPTPPPRTYNRFEVHRSTWHAAPPTNHGKLRPIDEHEEKLPSPVPPNNAPAWIRPARNTQSMREGRFGPRGSESGFLAPDQERPPFNRQSSRGDPLISRVLSTVKTKKPLELSVVKGELVKVTNNAMSKKWCVAVTTTGKSGSLRKAVIEQIDAVWIAYSSTNPSLSRRQGVINHIALRASQKNIWTSPIDAHLITITPSSLHHGDVGMLVKMTDYLLCCTDGEEKSYFEIDLHHQRMLKMTGYVLQCHSEGLNGAPRQWRLDGSHNGTTWSCLSEQRGECFSEAKPACYFPVENPTPCRYFRLTQLSKNSALNFRFCLSGIEIFGHLYSSLPEERFSYRSRMF